MQIEIGQTNRLGNRPVNQDRHLVLTHESTGLLVVADGMGGHARGELAAQILVELFARSFERTAKPIRDPYGYLKRVIERAHGQIQHLGAQHDPPIDPRTTCVACLVQDGMCWWAHVGDSRLYLFRAGGVRYQTQDHTPVENLYQEGLISQAERSTHPLRHYVNECVGGTGPEPSISTGPPTKLVKGDVLVLCSDGLWGAVDEPRMAELLERQPLEAAIEQLGFEAERDSYPQADNISVVALRWWGKATKDHDTSPRPSPSRERQRTGDPVESALAEIRRALHEYGDEMPASGQSRAKGDKERDR